MRGRFKDVVEKLKSYWWYLAIGFLMGAAPAVAQLINRLAERIGGPTP